MFAGDCTVFRNILSEKETADMKVCIQGAGEKKQIMDIPTGAEVVRVDYRKLPETDIVLNLQIQPQLDSYHPDVHWGLPAETYHVVIAEHIAEHIWDRIAFLAECRRILQPGGLLILEVPSWKHESAHANLEHRSTWSRAIFGDTYVMPLLKFRLESTKFRIGLFWRSFGYVADFWGRMLDRLGLATAYRFYLRKL